MRRYVGAELGRKYPSYSGGHIANPEHHSSVASREDFTRHHVTHWKCYIGSQFSDEDEEVAQEVSGA